MSDDYLLTIVFAKVTLSLKNGWENYWDFPYACGDTGKCDLKNIDQRKS